MTKQNSFQKNIADIYSWFCNNGSSFALGEKYTKCITEELLSRSWKTEKDLESAELPQEEGKEMLFHASRILLEALCAVDNWVDLWKLNDEQLKEISDYNNTPASLKTKEKKETVLQYSKQIKREIMLNLQENSYEKLLAMHRELRSAFTGAIWYDKAQARLNHIFNNWAGVISKIYYSSNNSESK